MSQAKSQCSDRGSRIGGRLLVAGAGIAALLCGARAGADAPGQEWFGSPVSGVKYRCEVDPVARTKRLVAPDGRSFPTTSAVIEEEAKDLAPLQRLMPAELLAKARDPERADELVNATFLFRKQPLYEAGVAARERARPRLEEAFARRNRVLDRIAPLRAMPDGRAPDVATAMRDEARLLTEEERNTLREVSETVRATLATLRAEAFAEATPLVRECQAPLAQHVRGIPGAIAFGGSVTLNAYSARVPLSALLEIAERFPELLRIEEPVPTHGQMDTANGTIGAGSWWSAGYNGTSSTKIAVLDTGVDTSHPALQNVVSGSAIYLAAGIALNNLGSAENTTSTDDFQGHGTRAAGILVSSDTTHTGVAYGGTILNVKCGYLTNAASPPTQTMQFADGQAGGDWAFNPTAGGATALSMSFAAFVSSNGTGQWPLFFDAGSFSLGVPVALACRNNGPGTSTCGTPADAFNIISCGSFDDAASTSHSDDTIASASGRGPTSDGRIKPDLCGPGENITTTEYNWEASSATTDDMGTSLTGTSNVVPIVAGAYSLLQDYGAAAYPAGLICLLQTTADNSSPYGGPDNTWGYGALDLAAAYTYRASVRESQLTSTGARYVLLRGGSISSGGRVGLVWSRQVTSAGANTPTTYYPIQDLDLYAYDGSSGASIGSSTGTVAPNERLAVSASASSPVYKVYLSNSSFTSSYATEPFAVAAESTSSTTVAAPPTPTCTFTTFTNAVAGSTNSTVTCQVANSGGVKAFAPQVTLTLPSGYTLVSGSNPATLSDIAASGSASATWTIRSHAGPSGPATISATATTTSFGETFTSATLSRDQTVDVDAPSGTIAINGGDGFSGGSSVVVTMSVTDAATGVSQMRVRNAGAAWGAWTAYAVSVNATLTSGEGSRTFEAQFMDAVGNVSATISDSIVVDDTPPTGSVSIEGGATYGGNSSVTLTTTVFDAGSGVAEARYSHDGSNWGAWQAYAASVPWILVTGEGARTVHAQFRDAAGLVSAVTTDSIVIETSPPFNCSVVIAGGATWATTRDVALTLSAQDSVSGVKDMRFSNVGGAWSAWQTYATGATFALSVGDGSKTVYAQFRDYADNVSTSVSDSINLDATGPVGTATIAGGDFVSALDVTLDVSASDALNGVSQMRFSNDDVNFGAWIAYATSADWTLASGEGAKTVYAQFKDGLGNVSPSTSDSIDVDTVPPTGTVLVLNDAAAINTTNVTLNMTWADASSGVAQMRTSNDDATWSPWGPLQSLIGWSLTAGDGQKVVYAQFRDVAGNVSTSVGDSILVDTIVPTGTVALAPGAGYVLPWETFAADTTSSDGAGGSGVASFRSSADGGANWTSWAPMPPDGRPAVPRPAGSDDTRVTIQGQFRDLAGNVSTVSSDDAFLVDDQAADVTLVSSFAGTLGLAGDHDALRTGLVKGDKLSLKLKTKPLVKKADARVEIDVYGPDHAKLVTGRFPATAKAPGVTNFLVPTTGEYWIVVRPAGAAAGTGVSYTLTVKNAAPKTSRALKGSATPVGAAATVEFDAAGGMTLAGTLVGPTTSPPTLTAPDGTNVPVSVVPGKKTKILPLKLTGGTGKYRLTIPASGAVTYQLAISPGKLGKLAE